MSELLVSGGRVLGPDHDVSRADVLVDQDAGTITAVGDPGTVGPGDDVLDASGSLVIPGLVNAHTHVAMTLLRGYADDKPLDAWLREDIWPVEGAMEPADVEAGAELGAVEMIRSGTTAFADMYFDVEHIADAVERTGLRAVLGHTAVTVGKDDEGAREDVQQSLDVADRLDGAADGRISTTVQPHSLTTVDPGSLADLAAGARERGFPLHYHANETRQEVEPILEDHGARPLAMADDRELLGPADWIAHGVHLDATEIDLLAERGTGVAHCPSANMKLASGLAPVQSLLEAGVTVAIGTDGPASNNDLDLLEECRLAALVGKVATDDASATPADAVLRAGTRGGAELLGIDAGVVEPGANADLAVVDLEQPHLSPPHDLVSHLVYAASGGDVVHTVCDGSVLMRDRDVQVVDEAAVRERANERAGALLERADV